MLRCGLSASGVTAGLFTAPVALPHQPGYFLPWSCRALVVNGAGRRASSMSNELLAMMAAGGVRGISQRG